MKKVLDSSIAAAVDVKLHQPDGIAAIIELHVAQCLRPGMLA